MRVLVILYFLWTIVLSQGDIPVLPSEKETAFDLPLSTTSQCQFPQVWIGTWFHLGFPHPLNISRNTITSKGSCFKQHGSHFLLRERLDNSFMALDGQSNGNEVKFCLKCMLIIEKHRNVLQYKESYCEPWTLSFEDTQFAVNTLCASIMADSALFYMFRVGPNLETTPCPFQGTHTFSYSTRSGKDICGKPSSQLEQCTDQTRLLFQFQACPDVPGSESADHELSCLATWSEGSSRFLVGQWQSRHHHRHSNAREMSNYHCFRHERRFENQEMVVKMAQSFKSSCMGLWSVDEGARTFELHPVSTEFEECGLPSWMTVHRSWKSLDHRMRLEFLEGSSRRLRIYLDGQEGEMQCHDIFHWDEDDQDNRTAAVILRHKMGCSMGFTCLHMKQMHPNVIYYQIGNMSRYPTEACSQFYFNPQTPYQTLVAEHVSMECPLQGKFEEIKEPVFGHQTRQHQLRSSSPCTTWLKGGCPLSSNLQMFSCDLSDLPQILDFQCLGSWTEVVDPMNNPNQTSQILVLSSLKKTVCIQYEKSESTLDVRIYGTGCGNGPQTQVTVRHEGPCHDALIDSSSISKSSHIVFRGFIYPCYILSLLILYL